MEQPSILKGFSTKKEWIATDAWRGGFFPLYYVAGANDTGMWSDSPCRTDVCKAELEGVRKHLRKNGIGTRLMCCQSSNLFMVRRFVIVKPQDLDRATALVSEYMDATPSTLLYQK